jgi:hypothetical protein
MKAYGGVDVYIHIFLTSALVGGELSASRPGRFTFGERAPGSHWVGGWVEPRAGLEYLEKRKFLTLPGLELRSLGRPAHSQSLYRLQYPGSHKRSIFFKNCSLEKRGHFYEFIWLRLWGFLNTNSNDFVKVPIIIFNLQNFEFISS